MRTGGTRISRAHNLAQQNERWIGELVLFHDRIERNIFAVMPKLAIGHVEHDSVIDLCPVSVMWQEDKLCISVDEFLDEPWAGNSIDFNFLAGDPFHELDFVSWQLGSGMRSLLLCFTALTKSLLVLRPSASARGSVGLLSKPVRHCRFLFILYFFGSAEAGIRNSARPGSIIHFSRESVLVLARSRSFFFFKRAGRYRLFRLF